MSYIKTLALTTTALLLSCSDYSRDNPFDYVNNRDGSPDDGGGYSSPSGGVSYTGIWSLEHGEGSTINYTEKDAGSITVYGNISNLNTGNAWASWIMGDNVASPKLKTATSISFKAKGDGKTYQVKLPTRDIQDIDFGYYYTTFTASSVEQTITVNISDFKQPNWVQEKTAFNKDEIISIDYSADGNEGITGPFGPITISDIRIYSN